MLGRFDGIMHHGWVYMVVVFFGDKGGVVSESVGRGKAQLGMGKKPKGNTRWEEGNRN